MALKRICCFCECWGSGGIESFLHAVLSRMDLSGLEVDIVAARMDDSVFTDALKERGIRFVELSGRPWRLITNHRRFDELLRTRDYHVVHFNLFQSFSLRYAAQAQRHGVPVRIAHSHNTALRSSLGRSVKLLLHRMGRRCWAKCATKYWACSKDAGEFLFGGDRKAVFIPNGIEVARFRFDPAMREEVRAELGLTDSFVVGNVGRLCQQKNQDFLLEVFAEVLNIKPNSRLLLVGDGDFRISLEEKSAQLGIAEQVTFYGTSTHVELLMWAMDVFVFPSLFEGLGIVAVEAQAAGLPVLCSEYIPTEANVTPLFHTLPLNAGADTWAEAITKLQTLDWQDCTPLICDAGFDVANVAKRVEATYRDL